MTAEPPITYVRASLDRDCAEQLARSAIEAGVPDVMAPEKMHCTVLYSRSFVSDLGCDAWNLYPMQARAAGWDAWDIPGVGRHLVLLLDAPDVHARHQALRLVGGSHDFPVFNPHISICKNLPPEFDLAALPDYEAPLILDKETARILGGDYDYAIETYESTDGKFVWHYDGCKFRMELRNDVWNYAEIYWHDGDWYPLNAPRKGLADRDKVVAALIDEYRASHTGQPVMKVSSP